MTLFQKYLKIKALLAVLFVVWQTSAFAGHPNLVITTDDVQEMRKAIAKPGRFADAYDSLKSKVDKQIALPMNVPVPKDGGGGYTHEVHKKNYQLMFDAGVVYQLSQDKNYANFVRDMLLSYARLYPTLDVHPQRKVNSQNPGKFFWQSLNEAVWLVHTIQAYDLIHDALQDTDIQQIEQQLLKPVALFLSDGQPSTFNKVHNHGTWATAGVGMAGFVMNEPEWVDKALLDLDKSGKGGFLRQLDELFSPQGYYNEGPYYQRYALMPFVTFAKAIENNQPETKIFEYRDNVLLKAIDTTIQLSYNGLFFPINDAIKSKGIDTIELVHGVTVAYGLTQNPGLLDIAQQQGQIVLSGDGLKVAQALDARLTQPYQFDSVAFGDGNDGKQGAFVVMRNDSEDANEASVAVFKPAAQGLGHGHFDKLTWQFYDKGNEIVSDYGAVRFLNVEAKFGGRYLPENNSYAKQTIAHNTVVVDETSHFNGNVKTGNANHPTLNFFESNQYGSVASGEISTVYDGVTLERTIALINLKGSSKSDSSQSDFSQRAERQQSIVLDLFTVKSSHEHQLDLPVHYQGQLIDTSFDVKANTLQLSALGETNGYQHLWLKGEGLPKEGIAQVSWLNDNGRFYTQTSLVNGNEAFLFTQIGANDPNFNLRNEQAFIRRVTDSKQHTFVSVLEPHGEYNPSKEYTLQASSQVSALTYKQLGNITLVQIDIAEQSYLVAINQQESLVGEVGTQFTYKQHSHSLNGRLAVYPISGHLE